MSYNSFPKLFHVLARLRSGLSQRNGSPCAAAAGSSLLGVDSSANLRRGVCSTSPCADSRSRLDALDQEPSRKNELFTDADSVRKRKVSSYGKYYPVDEMCIREAFTQWYKNRRSKQGLPTLSTIHDNVVIKPLPKFRAGCAGLQHEFAQSRYPYLMFRDAYAVLWDRVLSPQHEAHRRWLVRGAPGVGKSVMLAATAEFLRKQGWLVLYIPDCQDITMRNLIHSRNEDTGMFDTRDSTRNILRAFAEAHADRLAGLQQTVPGGVGSLLDLCTLPGKTETAALCNAVVRLKLELYRLPSSERAAVVVDNYNALFWRTEYHWIDNFYEGKLRRIDAQELTIAANLRVLEDRDVGAATVIAAVSVTGGVPDLPVTPPRATETVAGVPFSKFVLPPLSAQELGAMLLYYRHVCALSPQTSVTWRGVEAAHQLTQGSGTEVRRNLHFLLPYSKSLDNMDMIGQAYADVPLDQW